jgi:hypothetical protein
MCRVEPRRGRKRARPPKKPVEDMFFSGRILYQFSWDVRLVVVSVLAAEEASRGYVLLGKNSVPVFGGVRISRS